MSVTFTPDPHDWDRDTDYCMKCGILQTMYEDGAAPECAEGDNVTGLSHRIVHRAWAKQNTMGEDDTEELEG